jgi:hypothetical protein
MWLLYWQRLIYDYDNIAFTYIHLEKKICYYSYYPSSDEDEEDGYKKYKKRQLEPSIKPIVIYSNNTFSNNTFSKLTFEKKYKILVHYELKICDKTWDNVNKIIKKEERYER